jgi:histidinol-phosphate/aromatic aminotransferase/cobyric acid decarboxylase-like protein
MTAVFSPEQRREFVKRGFSRRNFGRIAAMLTAGATLPFYNESALAQLSRVDNAPPNSVWINSNENPLGPSPEAREAARKMVDNGGRYMFGEAGKVKTLLAE